jgi:autotransporter strand-loop-strand O-heptosyltransferase
MDMNTPVRLSEILEPESGSERDIDVSRDFLENLTEASAAPAQAAPPAASATISIAAAAPNPTGAGKTKASYPDPAATPTQEGPRGIRFDFNQGARVTVPERAEGSWRVTLRDLDTANILFQSENKGATIRSSKRFYVRFGIEVQDIDASGAATTILTHEYDATGRDILIQFPIGTLGDIMAWFPYAARFAQVHGCRLICGMSALIIPLLRDAYPHIRFVTHAEIEEQGIAETVYATYCIGLFFDDAAHEHQPTDFRHVGLHRTAGYILGVDPTEERPRISLPDESRPIAEPYVCIAVQASTQCKHWNNPHGWREVVLSLKARGYRVICIDQKAVNGTGLTWTHIPNGAEDETGDKPLAERARMLRHADAFIGLSSGLAWLAWAAGCPVVMISGFTHPTNEFETPYRVINWHACNGCWNDIRHRFDHHDFMWCPRHANTPQQFECTRLITGSHVIATINRIPGLKQPVSASNQG